MPFFVLVTAMITFTTGRITNFRCSTKMISGIRICLEMEPRRYKCRKPMGNYYVILNITLLHTDTHSNDISQEYVPLRVTVYSIGPTFTVMEIQSNNGTSNCSTGPTPQSFHFFKYGKDHIMEGRHSFFFLNTSHYAFLIFQLQINHVSR